MEKYEIKASLPSDTELLSKKMLWKLMWLSKCYNLRWSRTTDSTWITVWFDFYNILIFTLSTIHVLLRPTHNSCLWKVLSNTWSQVSNSSDLPIEWFFLSTVNIWVYSCSKSLKVNTEVQGIHSQIKCTVHWRFVSNCHSSFFSPVETSLSLDFSGLFSCNYSFHNHNWVLLVPWIDHFAIKAITVSLLSKCSKHGGGSITLTFWKEWTNQTQSLSVRIFSNLSH